VTKAKNALFELADFGVSVWCDELSRDIIRGGRLQELIDERAVVGVTSNPTIFQKAMSEGSSYDADIERMASAGQSREEIYRELVITDIGEACDVLRPVYDRTQGADGFVSVEVSPDLADDTAATIEEAALYHERIARPNLLVKIPATKAGVPAIEHMIGTGRSINVTLTFSVDRYEDVAQAYLRGLEKRKKDGGDLRAIASVASFFVSRVDTEADRRLAAAEKSEKDPAARRRLESLKGTIAVANARLAFERFRQIFSGPRWETLASAGAHVQRCLWASTSTKNPAYSDILYVESLVGGPTVNTMPIPTMEAYRDHGHPSETLTKDVDQARRDIGALADFGIDYSDITDNTLEREGVRKFAESYAQLLELLATKRHRFAGMETRR
jgi:transaldolase